MAALQHISDTAIWISNYRARETRRKNPLFRDPFAGVLLSALEKEGRLRTLPKAEQQAWPILSRTLVIDELVTGLCASGVSQVVNLASGLDTRPYRLSLPGVSWWDVDFSEVIEFKSSALKDSTPTCELIYRGVDLLDPSQVEALWNEISGRGKKTLAITEGLLLYLNAEIVTGLGKQFHRQPHVDFWISDFVAEKVLSSLQKKWNPHLGPAPMQFAPPSGPDWFHSFGWTPLVFYPHLLVATSVGLRPVPTTPVKKTRTEYLRGGVSLMAKSR